VKEMTYQQPLIEINSYPPSVRKVFFFLKENGPVTSNEILTEVKIAKRTLRDAINLLTSENLIERIPVLEDMRLVQYKLIKAAAD
jgi:transcription initiation factor IIE alpha subunit